MRHPARFSAASPSTAHWLIWHSSRRLLRLLPSIALGALLTWASAAQAQTPNSPNPAPRPAAPPAANPQSAPAANGSAPAELTALLSQVDAAASRKDLPGVLRFYSPQFSSSDGLNYNSLQEALKTLWQRYPGLTYRTEVNSWRREGNAIVAETTTTITGAQQPNGRNQKLTSTIASRQRIEGQKIVQQEILSERSEMTLGSNPPAVQVNLPRQVTTGQQYEFDAVVTEPLGDRLLLGAAMEEPITPSGYLNPAPVSLELLSAGGLFKVGRAPNNPGAQWVSAVVVREDGITAVTQRLQVVGRNSAGGKR